jgi:hypothetical protein
MQQLHLDILHFHSTAFALYKATDSLSPLHLPTGVTAVNVVTAIATLIAINVVPVFIMPTTAYQGYRMWEAIFLSHFIKSCLTSIIIGDGD